jgi:hypothetical protein
MAFIYPSIMHLQQIAQVLGPRLAAQRVPFGPDLFPIVNVDQHNLEWEQLDDVIGLQQGRGLNGQPARIQRLGGKRYMVEPGVYGEYAAIDERELTIRRPWGASDDTPINVTDLVLECQNQLLQRRLDRQEWIVWTLMLNGTVTVPAPNNAVIYTDQYTMQSFDSGVGWGTPATSTPLADFRAVRLKGRGYGVSFGSGAKAYMNQVTLNNMLSNTNPNDIGGRRGPGLATINSADGVQQLLTADGLPTIVPYDEGYLAEPSGTFTTFLPDNRVVVVGRRRNGESIGQYRMTRNANNPGAAPGPYMKVVDDPDVIPRTLTVHDGHSGGPVLTFPSAICIMDVS